MKNIVICFVLGFSVLSISAQIKLKTYYEKNENGNVYYADNDEECPVSIKINLKLKNYKSSNGNNKVFTIPAKTKKFEITTLTKINNKKKSSTSGSSRLNYGIHNLQDYQKDFIYDLPFEKGESFKLSQGYNGKASHQNENALDFTMPVGTNIVAVRDGIVVKVVKHNTRSCPKPECKKYNNLILVYHSDGTFAEYVHLKRNTSKVSVGDLVKKGQVIAQSGNTGWSTGPHLHLVIYKQDIEDRVTLETKFKVDNGEKTMFLVEKESYSKNYN